MTDILSEQVPSYDILEVAPQVISGGGGAWGTITGNLADQTDLNTALGGKAATVHVHATSDVTGLDTALGLLAPKSAPTFTTSATFSFLTTGRVPYATTGGSVIDSANFTYNGTAVTIQSAVAATSTDGLVLATTATATVGNQKFSPAFHQTASGWKTNATAGAQTTEWKIEVQPVQGAANPNGTLVFSSSTNGSAFTPRWFINGDDASYPGSLRYGSPGSSNLGLAPWTNGDICIAGSSYSFRFTDYSTGMAGVSDDALVISNSGAVCWSSAAGATNTPDLALMREAAANLRLGGTASASPVAQTLSVQNASGSNISAAATWTLVGPLATGSGTAGRVIVKVDNNQNPGASNPHTAVNTFQVGWDGIGYATGCGGAVTQTTGRTTGVTLDKPTGAITLVSAAGSATWQSFTVTNNTVAATDTINVSQKSGTDLYMIFVTAVAAGSFRISFATTGGTTTEQPVFNFAVLKAVAS